MSWWFKVQGSSRPPMPSLEQAVKSHHMFDHRLWSSPSPLLFYDSATYTYPTPPPPPATPLPPRSPTPTPSLTPTVCYLPLRVPSWQAVQQNRDLPCRVAVGGGSRGRPRSVSGAAAAAAAALHVHCSCDRLAVNRLPKQLSILITSCE